MADSAVRWRMLALLFIVRSLMGFQFQLIGALSPLIATSFGIGLADIGLLIGLYLAPGIVMALPGGSLAGRFGDRRLFTVGIVLMTAGGVLAVVGESYEAQIAARVIAGTGGVIVNVTGAKIVADWFAGREIATAMAIYVNSWPVGIALALAVLPATAAFGGLDAAFALTAVLTAAALILAVLAWRDAPAASGPAVGTAWPRGRTLALLGGVALLWALFNTAIILVFSFGPALLTERGLPLIAASATTSLVMWLAAFSVPLGGILADRTGRRDLILVVGLLGFAAGLVAVRTGLPPLAGFLLIGLLGGLPAGPALSYTAAILPPAVRAAGMGLFYTVFYLLTLIGPALAGVLAVRAGSATAAFDAALGCVAVCLILATTLSRAIPRAASLTRAPAKPA